MSIFIYMFILSFLLGVFFMLPIVVFSIYSEHPLEQLILRTSEKLFLLFCMLTVVIWTILVGYGVKKIGMYIIDLCTQAFRYF